MLTLGVDTSNYATSLAVVCTDTKEVVCDSKRFLPVKEGQHGLRQSDAVFHHTAALPEMLEELNARVPLERIGAVGVSVKPRPVDGSYMPCFLVGKACAQAVALARGATPVFTTHQQGHVAAALYAANEPSLWKKESIVFHISGGTTEMLLCRGYEVLSVLGGSEDLYAGQAVDRVGVRLGFPFPAGQYVSELAQKWGEPVRPKVSVRGMNCSLSGLENQCDALMKKQAPAEQVAHYCLSYIAQTVLKMIQNARELYPGLPVVCAGGVMSSDVIRGLVSARAKDVFFVPGKFSSDNAIGAALIAANEVGQWNKQ